MTKSTLIRFSEDDVYGTVAIKVLQSRQLNGVCSNWKFHFRILLGDPIRWIHSLGAFGITSSWSRQRSLLKKFRSWSSIILAELVIIYTQKTRILWSTAEQVVCCRIAAVILRRNLMLQISPVRAACCSEPSTISFIAMNSPIFVALPQPLYWKIY